MVVHSVKFVYQKETTVTYGLCTSVVAFICIYIFPNLDKMAETPWTKRCTMQDAFCDIFKYLNKGATVENYELTDNDQI